MLLRTFDLKEFNEEDRQVLLARAKREAKMIHAKESKDGRSYDEVLQSSLFGLAAEVFLINYGGFYDNPTSYQDIQIEGVAVEVKVTKTSYYLPHVLDRLAQRKIRGQNVADWVIVYTNDRDSAGTKYSYLGTFGWNKKSMTYRTANLDLYLESIYLEPIENA